MWDDSALSEPIQDRFVSCNTSLMASSASPGSTNINHRERSSPLTSSITEITQEFQLHSLQPQPLIQPAKVSLITASSRPTYLARKPSATMHKSNQKRQHRPSPIRRQSSSAKISRLMALAQGLESSGYGAPLDRILQDKSGSPQQIQPSSPSAHFDPLQITSSTPGRGELESQDIISSPHRHTSQVDKGSTRLDSGETPAGQRLVQKDIRLRTKWRGSTPGH